MKDGKSRVPFGSIPIGGKYLAAFITAKGKAEVECEKVTTAYGKWETEYFPMLSTEQVRCGGN